jgi:hypothetical protein
MNGRKLRDAGIALVSIGREEWISKARKAAIRYAQKHGFVTINDVREQITLPEHFSPNVWGAILRGDDFQAVGYTQATHPKAHARVIRIYKLKGN